jgi:hypothetical protein
MGSRRCKRRESSEDWPLRAGEAAGPAHIRWRVVAGRGGVTAAATPRLGLELVLLLVQASRGGSNHRLALA